MLISLIWVLWHLWNINKSGIKKSFWIHKSSSSSVVYLISKFHQRQHQRESGEDYCECMWMDNMSSFSFSLSLSVFVSIPPEALLSVHCGFPAFLPVEVSSHFMWLLTPGQFLLLYRPSYDLQLWPGISKRTWPPRGKNPPGTHRFYSWEHMDRNLP